MSNWRNNKMSKRNEKALVTILLIIFTIAAISMSTTIRNIAIVVIILIALFFLIKYIKRTKRLHNNDVYFIEHHCPNCGRMNSFKYPRGFIAKGTTVTCHYCGNRYIH